MAILKSKVLWSVLAVLILLVVIVNVLPKPLDMDLGKVGNGKAAVVFVYDPNLAVSSEQAAAMNEAREVAGDQASFLVLKAGSPNSAAFRGQHQARVAELLFFDGAGRLTGREMALLSADEILHNLSLR